MRSLLRHPFISLPMKFLARITWGAVWGVALSPYELEVKVGFGAVLAVLALALSVSFFGFDKVALSASRVALYGLLIAGEALAVGAIALAALGAFSGHVPTYALISCAFCGSVFPMYVMSILYRDNTSRAAGSNQ